MSRPRSGLSEIRAALGRSRRLFLAIGVFSAFVNVLMLTGPLFMLQVYDRVLTSRSEATLVALAGIVAFLFLAMGLLDHFRARVLARAGARFQAELDPRVGPCVREERPTDISQCCEAGRMTLGYLRVCASQRRSRRKTLHFNLLRTPRPTTTLAGRVVLPVSTGVAEFERPLIAIRTEEGRRTARAPDVPFDRRPELRPDQRTLAR